MERDRNADMKALEREFFRCLQRDDCEYGGIGVDCKRPFGNSDVEADILEIICAIPCGDDGDGPCWASWQREYAATLYDGLIDWLQSRYVK